MAASHLDIELTKYWELLSPEQKKSLHEVIKSFILADDKINLQLSESEADYNAPGFNLSKIIDALSEQQKEALLNLLESFGVVEPGQRNSIEQYNKEIDEAESRMDAGEFYTHEEVIEMSKKWIDGKK